MMDCKVSIIIPIYNGEKYISACIRGLLKQTYQNIECILVDDGSSDSSGKICDFFAEKDTRVKVLHQQNSGVSVARNAGIEIAEGKYLVFFDVDDFVTEYVIEENVKIAEKNNVDVVLFCFWYFIVNENKKIDNGMKKSYIGSKEEFFREKLIETVENEMFNAPWNKMYRKDFLIRNDLKFDAMFSIYEDAVFAAKMFQYADKIAINNKKYYTYVLRPTGSAITKYVDTYYKAITTFYKNAIDYCDMFEDNSKQKRKFSTVYMKLAMTNIKQISCHKKMNLVDKYQRIRYICDSKDIQQAIQLSDHNLRKALIKKLIQKKRYKEICAIYQLINFIQQKSALTKRSYEEKWVKQSV